MIRFARAPQSLHTSISEDPAVVDAGGGIVLGTAGRLGAVVLGAGGSAVARHDGDQWSWADCAGGHDTDAFAEAAPLPANLDLHESVWVEASPS